jgi:hypothetical protein
MTADPQQTGDTNTMAPLRQTTGWRRNSAAMRADAGASDSGNTARSLLYTTAQWEAECFAAFGEGRDPAACPECGQTGFFGPRIDATERGYRQCRFCGFTHAVGAEPQQFQAIVHSCRGWPTSARAPYVWWVAPEVESFLCPFCSRRLPIDEVRTPRPVDDPDHAWWRVPQGRKRFYYLRFWENWVVTKGRAYL